MTRARPTALLLLITLTVLIGCGDGGDGNDDVLRLEAIAGGLNLGDGGPATATYFQLRDLAIDDAGNVFVLDESNVLGSTLIRRIDARTGVITTVAGSCERTSPDEVAIDACHLHDVGAIAAGDADELFAATLDGRLYGFDATGPRAGKLAHLAGRGGFEIGCSVTGGLPAREACLGFISSMARDAAGALHLCNPSGAVSRFRTPKVPLTAVAGLFDEFACTAGESIPDGALATSGCVHTEDIAFDALGDLVLASGYDVRLRRVAKDSGRITTIAGTGSLGFCVEPRGDGGPAADACFERHLGVAAAASGDLFVADTDRLRRIDAATGTIEPLVTRGFVQQPVVTRDGGVLFGDGARQVTHLDPATGALTPFAGNGTASLCGDGGPAKTACLGQPVGIAVGPDGALYFADQENARVGRIDPVTDVTTTIAGGQRGFCGDGGPARDACFRAPSDVALDGNGNLYVADRGDDDQGGENDIVGRVRRVDVASGIVTTVAGNCETFGDPRATKTCLDHPGVLLLEADGTLLVGDRRGVWRIDLARDAISRVAGSDDLVARCEEDGVPALESCISAVDLARDAAGHLYVLDVDVQLRVRRLDAATSVVTTVAGNGIFGYCADENVPATSTCLRPSAIAFDDADRLIIADNGGFRAVDLATGLIRTIDGSPDRAACAGDVPPPEACTIATDIERDAVGRLIVSDVDRRRIQRVTLP